MCARLRIRSTFAVLSVLFALIGWQNPAIAASPTTTTLVVHKGGDRTGPQDVEGLEGATFDFYAGTSGNPPSPGDTPTASCTTGADGACSVDVPGRSLPLQGYWIVERTAPANWTAPEVLDVGFGAATTPTNYTRIFTGAVFNNITYDFPVAGTGSSSATRGSEWADIRDNPELSGDCGLNIALLLDVSGSVAPFLDDLKSAANGFVDALTGTPSQIALFSFASTAQSLAPLTSVADASSAAPLKATINGLSAGGGTNWDSGLWQVAPTAGSYDAVLMLTDGNPTFYGPHAEGPGSATRFREIENGIFSANAVKEAGAKVIAVGIGAGVTGSTNNLISVSGPVENVDYFQTDFEELEDVLRKLALEACAGTITVVKRVIPPGGEIGDATPGVDWEFSTTTDGVTPTSGNTAPVTGAVNFQVDLGGQVSKPVTLSETLQPDYTLVQQSGLNAACTADGNTVAVTNDGATGFIVDALSDEIVSCTVYNQAPAPPASVQVKKTWNINGTEYDNPNQPSDFQSTLSLTGQTNPQWGEIYGGYMAGDTVTVDESMNRLLLPIGCTVDVSGDMGDHTLEAGLNVFNVANVVTCTTKLTLKKKVRNFFPDNPTPDPSEWTLSAYSPGDMDPLFSGTTGVTSEVEPDVHYSLGESSVPGYEQEIVDGAVIEPPATGSWHCILETRRGQDGPEFDGLDGTVAVELGHHAICVAFNDPQPAKLTLVKEVVNEHRGTAGPVDWVLSATPPEDSEATPITGVSGSPEVTEAEATPGVAYTLAESDGPSGYEEDGVTCVLTGTETEVPVEEDAITPELAQDITCTFRNRDVPGGGNGGGEPVLPTTGYSLTLLFVTGLVAMAGGAVMIRRRWTIG